MFQALYYFSLLSFLVKRDTYKLYFQSYLIVF